MSSHVFVDESMPRSLVLVAVRVQSCDVGQARKTMKSLRLGSQRRVHFKKERTARKNQIIDVISELGITASAYVTEAGRPAVDARRACLQRIVEDHADAARLIVETDDSMLDHDKRALFDACKKAGSDVRYEHQRAFEEPLLWVPDAIAWCWTTGGRWRASVRDMVVETAVLE